MNLRRQMTPIQDGPQFFIAEMIRGVQVLTDCPAENERVLRNDRDPTPAINKKQSAIHSHVQCTVLFDNGLRKTRPTQLAPTLANASQSGLRTTTGLHLNVLLLKN